MTEKELKRQYALLIYSLLASGTPEQQSKIIQDLGYACQEWGFFMVRTLVNPCLLVLELGIPLEFYLSRLQFSILGTMHDAN